MGEGQLVEQEAGVVERTKARAPAHAQRASVQPGRIEVRQQVMTHGRADRDVGRRIFASRLATCHIDNMDIWFSETSATKTAPLDAKRPTHNSYGPS